VFIFAASKEMFPERRRNFSPPFTNHPELTVDLIKEFRLEAIEFTTCTKSSPPKKLQAAKRSSRSALVVYSQEMVVID